MYQAKGKTFSERQVFWSLLIILTVIHACGKDHPGPDEQQDDPPPTGSTKPEIISFSPARGAPGTEVTITGKNFKTNVLQNYAIFSGALLEAFISNATTTELKVKVPDDAVTGKIIVKVGNQSDTSATDFIIDPPVTAITDFTPRQGPFGTVVTLTGTKFGNNIKVKLNGIEAKVSSKSTTRIVFTIPVNTTLTAHKVTLLSDNDSLGTADPFTVTADGPYAHWEYKNVDLFSAGLPAFYHGLSFVHNNKIYWGFTGMGFNETFADYVVYDPTQHSKGWEYHFPPPGEMAPADLMDAVAVVHNNRVFLGTGLTGSGANSKWWEFHPTPVTQQSTSTRLTDFPQQVSGAVAFTLNNKIFVGFGGVNKTLFQFDPAGNNNKGSWPTIVATAPFSELNSGSAVVLDNAVYFGRALPAMLQERNAFYKFTESGGITRVTDMPEDLPSFFTPSFKIGSKAYFVINSNVWEYTPDAAGGSWRAVISAANMPTIVKAAVLTVNGIPVVFGWNSSGRLFEFKFN